MAFLKVVKICSRSDHMENDDTRELRAFDLNDRLQDCNR